MSIGERSQELRKKQGLSQADLAASLSISRQAVSKWESDSSSPDTLNLIKLSDLLDTDLEYLASGRRPPSPPAPIQVNYINQPQKIVEKIIEVEKPVPVEKIIEVEKPVVQVVEKTVEKPIIHKVVRIRYKTNPAACLLCLLAGLLAGVLLGLFL